MASDDWRLRIELGHEEKGGLLGRLGLRDTEAEELAAELRDLKLAVTEENGTLHVYAGSSLDLERARALIEQRARRARRRRPSRSQPSTGSPTRSAGTAPSRHPTTTTS